jgi:hypothetical protein
VERARVPVPSPPAAAARRHAADRDTAPARHSCSRA